MKPHAFLVAVAMLAGPAFAQDDFKLEDVVAECTACHGESGLPDDPQIPIIWGQQFFYTYTQLKDFAAGRRSNEVMTPMAARFSRDQMQEIAKHFSTQPWPAIQASTEPGDDALAERGIATGQCSACHGKWQGDSRIPRLAGQQPGYLAKTMADLKSDARANAPDMSATLEHLDEETVQALARYLSAL